MGDKPMSYKTTQLQVDKASKIMKLVLEQKGQFMHQIKLADKAFDSKQDRQAIEYLLNQNDYGLAVHINKHNLVEWQS